MTDGERLIWAAVFADQFGKRNKVAGAGQAAWDLKVAARNSAIEASDAIQGARDILETMKDSPDKQTQAYAHLSEMLSPQGESRCEHGMFYSGAGACPQCGGGADG